VASAGEIDQYFLSFKNKFQQRYLQAFIKDEKPHKVWIDQLGPETEATIKKLKSNGGVFHPLYIGTEELQRQFAIDFFMKDITKPALLKSTDRDKCGQGISAWHKSLNSAFCVILRAVEKSIESSMKNNIIHANSEKEAEFDLKVKALFNGDKRNFINDYTEWDKNNDQFTQMLEDWIIELFLDPKMLWLYREMRKMAKMSGKNFSLINYFAKNSGESDTLGMNNRVNEALLCITFTWDYDDDLVEIQGDDQGINSFNINFNTDLLSTLLPFIKLAKEAKIEFPKYLEFVGYFMTEYGIIPDLFRFMQKLLSKDLTKNKHIDDKKYYNQNLTYNEEIVLSVKDKMKFLTIEKLICLRQINLDIYGISAAVTDKMVSTMNYYIETKDKNFNVFSLF